MEAAKEQYNTDNSINVTEGQDEEEMCKWEAFFDLRTEEPED